MAKKVKSNKVKHKLKIPKSNPFGIQSQPFNNVYAGNVQWTKDIPGLEWAANKEQGVNVSGINLSKNFNLGKNLNLNLSNPALIYANPKINNKGYGHSFKPLPFQPKASLTYNFKSGGYIPTKKQQTLIAAGLLTLADAKGGEGPKTKKAWENYSKDKTGINIQQVQNLLIEKGYLTKEDLNKDQGLWGNSSETAYEKFNEEKNTFSGNDLLTSVLPLNIASVIDDIGGNYLNTDKTDIFTEKNLKETELKKLREISRKKLKEGETNIEYKDYETHLNPDGTIKESVLKSSAIGPQYFDVRGKDERTVGEQLLAETDPAYMLKTHFGRYSNTVLPPVPGHNRTTNDTLAIDQYNFNNADPNAKIDYQSNYSTIRSLAKKEGSAEGSGRNSVVRLNEDAPSTTDKIINTAKDVTKQLIKGPVLDLAGKAYDYFTQANGGFVNSYDIGGHVHPHSPTATLPAASSTSVNNQVMRKDYLPEKDPAKLLSFAKASENAVDKGAVVDRVPIGNDKSYNFNLNKEDITEDIITVGSKAKRYLYDNFGYQCSENTCVEFVKDIDKSTGRNSLPNDLNNNRQLFNNYKEYGYELLGEGESAQANDIVSFYRTREDGTKYPYHAGIANSDSTYINSGGPNANTLGLTGNPVNQKSLTTNESDGTPKDSYYAYRYVGDNTNKNNGGHMKNYKNGGGCGCAKCSNGGSHATGGYMQYANGGQFDTGGQMGEFSGVPVTEFNNGGSHEANPNGGIPQGPGALVEEGELKLDLPNGEQFIVSPKIMYKKNDKEAAQVAQELGITEKEFKKYAGRDMVSVFKALTRKNSFNGEKREGDTIQENSIEAEIMPLVEFHTFLTERKNAEEEAKKEQAFAQDMDMMMQEHPEYMQAMMAEQQQQAPQQQQGPSPEEQAMMQQQQMAQQGGAPQGPPQGMPMGRNGGTMYANGGVPMNAAPSYSDYMTPQQAMPVQGVAPMYAQGGQMQQAPQQGGQEQEIMGQVAQALQQGMAPEEVMTKLVEMGMPEEQAGGLVQGVMQQLEGGQQGQPQGQPMATGGNLHINTNYDKTHVQPSVFSHGGPPPHPEDLKRATANINTANTTANSYYADPANFKDILNSNKALSTGAGGNEPFPYKPYEGGFTASGKTVPFGYNSGVNASNSMTIAEAYPGDLDSGITNLPIDNYTEYLDTKGQQFYVPNYGVGTEKELFDGQLATETAQTPVMQNAPLQANKMKNKVGGKNNKYMTNVKSAPSQTAVLDEQGNPVMENTSTYTRQGKSINERTYNNALKSQEEINAGITQANTARGENIMKYANAYGGIIPQQYKNGAGMTMAGDVMQKAAPFLNAIPVIGQIAAPVVAAGGAFAENVGRQKLSGAEGDEISYNSAWGDAGAGVADIYLPGVGSTINSTVQGAVTDKNEQRLAEEAQHLATLNPDSDEYRDLIAEKESRAKSNKTVNNYDKVTNMANTALGAAAKVNNAKVTSNVAADNAFATAGGAPEGTTTGYSGGTFSGGNNMNNYSSYAPGFTAGAGGTAVPVSAGGGNANGGYMQYINGGVMNAPVNYNLGGRMNYATGGTMLNLDEIATPTTTSTAPAAFANYPAASNMTQAELDMANFLVSNYGWTPKNALLGVSVADKESGGKSVKERGYENTTDLDRIRKKFKVVRDWSDKKIQDLQAKGGDAFFDVVYDSNKRGGSLGNNVKGDGSKYAGRGLIQMTGKANYASVSQALYGDDRLLDNPDLLLKEETAGQVAAWWMAEKAKNGLKDFDVTKDIESENVQDFLNAAYSTVSSGGTGSSAAYRDNMYNGNAYKEGMPRMHNFLQKVLPNVVADADLINTYNTRIKNSAPIKKSAPTTKGGTAKTSKGYSTDMTTDEVKSLQKAMGLKQDGIYGKDVAAIDPNFNPQTKTSVKGYAGGDELDNPNINSNKSSMSNKSSASIAKEENKNIETLSGGNYDYSGEVKDGKMHGQGTLTWANGTTYEGNFKDDSMHGQGTTTFADGHQEKVFYENNEWRDDDSPFAQKIVAQDKIKNMGQVEFDTLPEEERKKLLSAAKEKEKEKTDLEKSLNPYDTYLKEEATKEEVEAEKEATIAAQKANNFMMDNVGTPTGNFVPEFTSSDPKKLEYPKEWGAQDITEYELAKEQNPALEPSNFNPTSTLYPETGISTPNTGTNTPNYVMANNLSPLRPAEEEEESVVPNFNPIPKGKHQYDYTQDLDDNSMETQYVKPTLLENMLGAAPGIANIAMGLGKSDKLNLNRIDPITGKKISLDQARKDARELYAANQGSMRNSAGSSGNYMANMQASYQKHLQGLAGITEREQNANAQIANQVAAQNAGIQGQNIGFDYREQDYDARTKAAKQNMIGTGIGQIADVYQGNQQNKFMTNTMLPTIAPDYAEFVKWQTAREAKKAKKNNP